MVDAQVAAEDQTFWTNPCIDFSGIVRAALQNFSSLARPVSGASTICQQLVRIRLFDADLMANPDRRWERKIKEAILALRVGDAYPGEEGKQKLLEMYLNQVYYGNNAYGIWAAASAPTSARTSPPTTPTNQLTVGEAAMLAGLVRAARRASIRRRWRCRRRTHARHDRSWSSRRRRRDPGPGLRARRHGRHRLHHPGAARPRRPPQQIVLAPPAGRASIKAPHFVYAVRRAAADLLGNEDLLDSRRPGDHHHPELQRATRSAPRNGRAWRTTWIA